MCLCVNSPQSFICCSQGYYFDFCVCYLLIDHVYRQRLSVQQRRTFAFLDSKMASLEYDKQHVIRVCDQKLKQVNLMDVVSVS